MITRPYQAFFILSLLIGLFFLTSCQSGTPLPGDPPQVTATGDAASPSKTPRPSATAQPTATATVLPHLDVDSASLSGQEIVFAHPWQGSLARQADALVGEFNKSNEWGIRVSVQPYYNVGALYDAVSVALEEDPSSVPDVVVANSDQIAAWADQSVIFDLNDYVSHAEFGLTQAERDAFFPEYWNQENAAGRQVGIPALRTARVVFYNQTWAKELGFQEPPSSLEEFQEQACAAAVKNNTAGVLEKYGTGGWLVDTNPITMLSWLSAHGAEVVPQAEGQPYSFETEEAEAALAYLRGLVDQGCAWVSRSPTTYDAFARRLALFTTGSLQDVEIQRNFNQSHSSADVFIVLPFPTKTAEPLVYSSGSAYALFNADPSHDDKSRMAAWLFVRWMSQPKNQALLAETYPSLPISSAVIAQTSDYQRHEPWDMVLPIAEHARPAPSLPSWRVVRRLLEDSAWQVFHLPADQLDLILPQLDQTSSELLEKQD